METKKFNYEAPEAVVFGVETQEHFLASGATVSSMSIEDVGEWDS